MKVSNFLLVLLPFIVSIQGFPRSPNGHVRRTSWDGYYYSPHADAFPGSNGVSLTSQSDLRENSSSSSSSSSSESSDEDERVRQPRRTPRPRYWMTRRATATTTTKSPMTTTTVQPTAAVPSSTALVPSAVENPNSNTILEITDVVALSGNGNEVANVPYQVVN